MKTQINIVLGAAMGLAAFAGPVVAPAAAQGSGSVVIYRGAEVETVRFDNRSGVTVERGQPAAKPVAPVRKAAHKRSRRVIAGNTLWIVDGKGRRLIACQVRSTTQVGGRRIRCIRRALPVALR